MTQLVFGAGLIGGYLAGTLSAQGFDTRLVARPQIQAKLEAGLTLTDLDGHRLESVPLRFHSDQQGDAISVLWLTVKCTAVAASLADLQGLVTPNTVVICCQNGFGSDQIIRDAFPNNTVLNAVVGFNVAEQAPGHLHRSTDGKLVVEWHPKVARLVQQVDCDLLPATCSRQFLADQWAKLQLNLANPVNALADIPVKAMTEDRGYRRIIAALMQELLTITKALQLGLPKITAAPPHLIPHLMRLPNFIFTRIAQKMLAIDPTARTSMWWDISQGKPSEIEFLNGAVVREGKALGIDCPMNAAIVRLVRQVEAGQQTIGLSAAELQAALNRPASKND